MIILKGVIDALDPLANKISTKVIGRKKKQTNWIKYFKNLIKTGKQITKGKPLPIKQTLIAQFQIRNHQQGHKA